MDRWGLSFPSKWKPPIEKLDSPWTNPVCPKDIRPKHSYCLRQANSLKEKFAPQLSGLFNWHESGMATWNWYNEFPDLMQNFLSLREAPRARFAGTRSVSGKAKAWIIHQRRVWRGAKAGNQEIWDLAHSIWEAHCTTLSCIYKQGDTCMCIFVKIYVYIYILTYIYVVESKLAPKLPFLSQRLAHFFVSLFCFSQNVFFLQGEWVSEKRQNIRSTLTVLLSQKVAELCCATCLDQFLTQAWANFWLQEFSHFLLSQSMLKPLLLQRFHKITFKPTP